MTTKFLVADASCGHCKLTIESTLQTIPAVTEAELNLATKQVSVRHAESVTPDELEAAIRGAGYTPQAI